MLKYVGPVVGLSCDDHDVGFASGEHDSGVFVFFDVAGAVDFADVAWPSKEAGFNPVDFADEREPGRRAACRGPGATFGECETEQPSPFDVGRV